MATGHCWLLENAGIFFDQALRIFWVSARERDQTYTFCKNSPLFCPIPVLGMKRKLEKSVIQLMLKLPLSITISTESSQRDLLINIVVDRLIYINN